MPASTTVIDSPSSDGANNISAVEIADIEETVMDVVQTLHEMDANDPARLRRVSTAKKKFAEVKKDFKAFGQDWKTSPAMRSLDTALSFEDVKRTTTKAENEVSINLQVAGIGDQVRAFMKRVDPRRLDQLKAMCDRAAIFKTDAQKQQSAINKMRMKFADIAALQPNNVQVITHFEEMLKATTAFALSMSEWEPNPDVDKVLKDVSVMMVKFCKKKAIELDEMEKIRIFKEEMLDFRAAEASPAIEM